MSTAAGEAAASAPAWATAGAVSCAAASPTAPSASAAAAPEVNTREIRIAVSCQALASDAARLNTDHPSVSGAHTPKTPRAHASDRPTGRYLCKVRQ